MKLDAIEQTCSAQGRVRLRFSDGSSRMVYPAVVARLALYAGMELSEQTLKQLEQVSGEVSARERAVRIISATTVSRGELERRLRQKGESDSDAQAAVQWLDELKLLDDRKTAELLVASAVRKGYGAARIRQILFEKRIPRELWDEALALVPAGDDAIEEFLRRRFRGKSPDKADCRRAADALARRGYQWSEIRRALQHYAPDGCEAED